MLWAVKEHLDTSNAPGRFIITGSVRAQDREQSPLTGRAEAIDLFPFSEAERRRVAASPPRRSLSGCSATLTSMLAT